MSETVSSQFKAQLASLLTIIRATTPHYVRCLKPNASAAPKLFERPSIVSQVCTTFCTVPMTACLRGEKREREYVYE